MKRHFSEICLSCPASIACLTDTVLYTRSYNSNDKYNGVIVRMNYLSGAAELERERRRKAGGEYRFWEAAEVALVRFNKKKALLCPGARYVNDKYAATGATGR